MLKYKYEPLRIQLHKIKRILIAKTEKQVTVVVKLSFEAIPRRIDQGQ